MSYKLQLVLFRIVLRTKGAQSRFDGIQIGIRSPITWTVELPSADFGHPTFTLTSRSSYALFDQYSSIQPYPLPSGNFNIAIENDQFIVNFPSYEKVIFHGYVSLPEGTHNINQTWTTCMADRFWEFQSPTNLIQQFHLQNFQNLYTNI